MKTESRFAFLSKEYVELHQYCVNAESDCMLNPTRAVQVARNAIEFIVTRIVGFSGETLYDRISKLETITGEKKVPAKIFHDLHDVRITGNHGSHAGSGNHETVTTEDAIYVIDELARITIWFYLKYEEKTCPKYCFAKQDYRTVMRFNKTIVADETGLNDEANNLINEAWKYYNEESSKNYKKALELYKKAADLNNANAEYNVGCMYYDGLGLEKPNYEEAFYYFTRAAENGYADSYDRIGYMYDQGLGVDQNHIKAFENFNIGATKGSNQAMYNLGVYYANGTGVTINYEEAYRWWSNAADKGNSKAKFGLGVYFQSIKNDEEKAELYYKQVAEEIPEAALNLAEIYVRSHKYTEAFNLYLIAAKAGIANAQYKVGCYYNSLSKKYDWSKEEESIKNIQESVIWLEKASSQGYPDADFLLGQIYEEGLFIMRSLKKAYEYYKKAAEGEIVKAMVKAGDLCINENPDGMTSLDWYMKAAMKDNDEAQLKVADYYFYNNNFKEAVYWYEKATEQGNDKAAYCLSRCYLYGVGVNKDKTKAIEVLHYIDYGRAQYPMDILSQLGELTIDYDEELEKQSNKFFLEFTNIHSNMCYYNNGAGFMEFEAHLMNAIYK